MSDQLSAKDWVDEGLKALASRGFTALKAEPLAKALRVSRGSFYWHFADIAAFHAAILARWHEVAAEDYRQCRGGLEGREPARAAAAPGFWRAADAGAGGPYLGERRPGRAGRRPGHRPAAAELCRGPAGEIRIAGGCGARTGPNSLLGVSRLCLVGPALAKSTATGRARRTGPDRRLMTLCDPVC